MHNHQKPLNGIRVVDLTSVISGPFCTMMLADQGADVIKLERPGVGDLTRHLMTSRNGVSSLFVNLNRNKRSIALDISREAEKNALRKLLADADVLVENFRPGTMNRLGLGYDSVKEINPGLIYVSINGFGSNGPCAKAPAYDPILQAKCGMIDQQRNPESGAVDLIRTQVCDKVASLTAAQAITAALFDRERGGSGRHLELALLDVTLAFYWPDGMMNHTFIGDGVELQRPMSSANRVYQTRDGHLILSPVQQKDVEGLCRALHCTELLEKPQFSDTRQRVTNYTAWEASIVAALRDWDTETIAARLIAEQVPHGVVNSPEQVLQDPQVQARQMLQEYQHPRAGRLLHARSPVVVDGDLAASCDQVAPELGQHSEEILREAGLTNTEIQALLRIDPD